MQIHSLAKDIKTTGITADPNPKHKFKPPYNPAISEYPNGDVIERPTAFKKLG